MGSDFHVVVRRYGPAVHLAPVGELDIEALPALARVRDHLHPDVAVVVCDMLRVSFMDVTGVNGLLALAHDIQARDMGFFAFRWARQPQRLLDLVDRVDAGSSWPPVDGRPAATAALRGTLGARAEEQRGRGVAEARADLSVIEVIQAVEAGGRSRRRFRTPG